MSGPEPIEKRLTDDQRQWLEDLFAETDRLRDGLRHIADGNWNLVDDGNSPGRGLSVHEYAEHVWAGGRP